jgi:hypothetical protein
MISCPDVVFLSCERVVVFLAEYVAVDLVAEKVGNVKDFLITNGVVEPLDAKPLEVVTATEVVTSEYTESPRNVA